MVAWKEPDYVSTYRLEFDIYNCHTYDDSLQLLSPIQPKLQLLAGSANHY